MSYFMRDPLLKNPLPVNKWSRSGAKRDAVLLTGGTGFVGTYMLRVLLLRDPSVHIFCVVRGGNKARLASQSFPQSIVEDETHTLEEKAEFDPVYGHKLPSGWSKRVTALNGDCGKSSPLFGLSKSDLHTVAERCYAVIHLACETSYVAPYSEMRHWAVTFNELCGMCVDLDMKLHYLGGLGHNVYKDLKPGDKELEESLYSNGYFRLKWVQHHLLERYFEQTSLQGCSYDVPYIFGAPETGGQFPGLHYEPIRFSAIFAAAGLCYDCGGFDTITVDVLCEMMGYNVLQGITEPRFMRIFDREYVSIDILQAELERRGYALERCASREEFIKRATARGIPKKKLTRYFTPSMKEDAIKIRVYCRPAILPKTDKFPTVPSQEVLKMSLDNVKAGWDKAYKRYKKFTMTSKM